MEEKDQQVLIKKGKTIFDYIGHLPDLKYLLKKSGKRPSGRRAKDHD